MMTKPKPTQLPTLQRLIQQVTAFIAYVVAGKLGFLLAFAQDSVSPFWPPTAIAILSILYFGYRTAFAIFLGALAVNTLMTTEAGVIAATHISIGNTLEAVTAVWFLRYFHITETALKNMGNFLKMVFSITIPGSAISATIGVTALISSQTVPPGQFNHLWLTWLTGDTMAALIIVPLVFAWRSHRFSPLQFKQISELALLTAISTSITAIIFYDLIPAFSRSPITFFIVLPIAWATFRFGSRGATLITAIVTLTAIIGTVNGTGPYVAQSVNISLLLLQGFIATVSLMTLSFAILVEYRFRMEHSLVKHNQQLTNKVQQQHIKQATTSDAYSHLHQENQFILSASADGLVVLNPQGVIIRASDAFCLMLQQPEAVILNQPLRAFLKTDQEFQLNTAMDAAKQTNTSTRYEVDMLSQSGHTLTVNINMMAIKERSPHLEFYLFTHDVTKKNKATAVINTLATSSAQEGQESQFFQHGLAQIAQFYGAKYAFIGLMTDQTPATLQTFSIYSNGSVLDNFECKLSQTPCPNIINVTQDLQSQEKHYLYPDTDLLHALGVKSYFGVPMTNRDGSIMGIVAVMDNRPLHIEPWSEQILQLFSSRITSELEHQKARDKIAIMTNKLAWQSSHDPLTGLLNRRMFNQQLEKALIEIQEQGASHTLFHCDLDQFQNINTIAGHTIGDTVLKQLSFQLKNIIQGSNILARLGGDKFGIII